jgi:hypothetical protein
MSNTNANINEIQQTDRQTDRQTRQTRHTSNLIKNKLKIDSIDRAIELVDLLLCDNYKVILFLDIDETILSSKIGKKFVEKNICKLVDTIYTVDPNNLIFLTARDFSLKSYTKNQLNRCKLLKKGHYIDYNIVCAPYNEKEESTKGNYLVNYINIHMNKIGKLDESNKTNELDSSNETNELDSSNETNESNETNNKLWIIFIDDLEEHIESVELSIKNNLPNINYTLMHYINDDM